MSLTRRQAVFVENYLATWNASEAARRAGYSDKTCYAIGCENLTKPEIAAAIAAGVEAQGMTVPEVLLRLTAIARGDVGDFVDVDAAGNVKLDVTKHPERLKLVKTLRLAKDGSVGLEMYDAQAALVALGKALGLLRENVNVQREEALEVTTRIVRVKNEPTE